MNDNEYLARTICEQLAGGSPVVMVSIVESRGSSPRHAGTRMVVGGESRSWGTIGGGLLEAKSLAESQRALQERQSRLVDFRFTGDAQSTDEMLCGGNARLLFDLIMPGQDNLEFFRRCRVLAGNGDSFYTLTTLNVKEDRVEVTGRSICSRDGTLTGPLSLSEDGMKALVSELRLLSSTGLVEVEGTTIAADPVRRTKTVYLFGAGHVAAPTARLAALAGFRVVVIDDRAEFASVERFPDAAEIIIPRDFTCAVSDLDIDEDSFLVIMTRGHRHDRAVLGQALRTRAAYIGMMGSLRKRAITYAELEKEGFTKGRLAQVHCPIGLPIGAETPEEIAVSVVAELVQERAGVRGHRQVPPSSLTLRSRIGTRGRPRFHTG